MLCSIQGKVTWCLDSDRGMCWVSRGWGCLTSQSGSPPWRPSDPQHRGGETSHPSPWINIILLSLLWLCKMTIKTCAVLPKWTTFTHGPAFNSHSTKLALKYIGIHLTSPMYHFSALVVVFIKWMHHCVSRNESLKVVSLSKACSRSLEKFKTILPCNKVFCYIT